MDMAPYQFANLNQEQEQRVKQLEQELHVTLIAYEKDNHQQQTRQA